MKTPSHSSTEIALYLSFLISGASTILVSAPVIGQRVGIMSSAFAGVLFMLLWGIAIPLVIISYAVAALLSIYCLIRLQGGVKVRILIFILLLLVVGAASDRAQSAFLLLAGAIPNHSTSDFLAWPFERIKRIKQQKGSAGNTGTEKGARFNYESSKWPNEKDESCEQSEPRLILVVGRARRVGTVPVRGDIFFVSSVDSSLISPPTTENELSKLSPEFK